jgi:tetratricopeptide (TPR) repeat protein
MTGSTERVALEEWRDRALEDLAALERSTAADLLDGDLVERLRRNSQAEVAAALEALDRVDGPRPAARWHRAPLVACALAALVGLVALAATAVGPRPAGGFVTGGVAADSDDAAVDPARGRDLASVSNEDMEEVVRANPDVVPMRLALVERYLRAGDPEKARRHALRALERPLDDAERARALKYLGWSTALVDRPAEGAALLEESLSLVPTDLDTMWFLGNVRLDAGGDPAGAAALFGQILAEDIPDDRRRVVAARLDDARRRLAGASGSR